MRRHPRLLIGVFVLGTALLGCHRPTIASPTVPASRTIDADTVTVTGSDVARPDDPDGLLVNYWPASNGARMAAISRAVLRLHSKTRVTVVHLGAEGEAMGLGDSVTGDSDQISPAFGAAALAVGLTKRQMASTTLDAGPRGRERVIEDAENLHSDLTRLGKEATHAATSSTPIPSR